MSRWKIKRRIKSARRKQEHREKREDQGITLISAGLPGCSYPTMVQQISAADAPAMSRYLKAHQLLPRDYDFDPRQKKYQRIVTMAVKLLEDKTAKKKELTRAIAILGHSPTPHAIEALERMAAAGHPLSGVARMALQECLGMASQVGLVTAPAAGGMN